jgi:hypothetical protein
MADFWMTKYVLAMVGWGYVALVLIALVLVLWLVKNRIAKTIMVCIVIALAAILPYRGYEENQKQQQTAEEFKARYTKAKALFDERCKTAGEKIYRTVENVEGILLVSPRLEVTHTDRASRDWVGAGFPGEAGGNQYIMEFLSYNKPGEGLRGRSLGPTPGGVRGYRYLITEENKSLVRYSMRRESDYFNNGDPVVAYGSREPYKGSQPRFSVAYENIEDSAGRNEWIAGGRIRVLDRSNGELLAEFVRYSFEAGFGNTSGGRSPWGFATQCPPTAYGGSNGHIRSFTEQVLKPKQGE